MPLLRSSLLLVSMLLLVACAGREPAPVPRPPQEIQAELLRLLPADLADRQGWARDIQVAFTSQALDANRQNLCAVLAVTEQESTFRADPRVPGLGGIARREIERRADAAHVPDLLLRGALALSSPDGRSYSERLAAVRSERELSELFDDFVGMVPLGRELFGGLNPVRTGGPMQVSVAFAEAHAEGYPYSHTGSLRDEVFSRRGGLYFGTAHLLGYPADYPEPLYRFADFNAGWYASRNAAFQAAVARLTGIDLALDGDLLIPGSSRAGQTEKAVRSLGERLRLSDAQIRRELETGEGAEFTDSRVYRRVFELADAQFGRALPRAVLPGIRLHSPKITRNLTTAWFANRVNERWKRCMAR